MKMVLRQKIKDLDFTVKLGNLMDKFQRTCEIRWRIVTPLLFKNREFVKEYYNNDFLSKLLEMVSLLETLQD